MHPRSCTYLIHVPSPQASDELFLPYSHTLLVRKHSSIYIYTTESSTDKGGYPSIWTSTSASTSYRHSLHSASLYETCVPASNTLTSVATFLLICLDSIIFARTLLIFEFWISFYLPLDIYVPSLNTSSFFIITIVIIIIISICEGHGIGWTDRGGIFLFNISFSL